MNELPDKTTVTAQTERSDAEWRRIAWLPCELSLQVPVSAFTVGDLVRLRPGTVIVTRHSRSAEIPLRANGQIIGSAELEPVGSRIGVRITELS